MRPSFELFKDAVKTIVAAPMLFFIICIFYATIVTMLMLFFKINPIEPSMTGPDFAFEILIDFINLFLILAFLKIIIDPQNVTFATIANFIEATFTRYLPVYLMQTLVVGMGFLLFIIPGVFFYVSLSFALFVSVLEGVRGSQALQRSYDYIKGKWWEVFGKYLFFIAICFPPCMLLAIGLLTFANTESFVSVFFINYASTLLFALFLAYTYRLYQDIHKLETAAPTPTIEAEVPTSEA